MVRLTISQQCAIAAKKVNILLGCIKRNTGSRSKKEIFPFYSAMVRNICPVLGSPIKTHNSLDMEILEKV